LKFNLREHPTVNKEISIASPPKAKSGAVLDFRHLETAAVVSRNEC